VQRVERNGIKRFVLVADRDSLLSGQLSLATYALLYASGVSLRGVRVMGCARLSVYCWSCIAMIPIAEYAMSK
jgi:hypothetical protein